MFAMTAGISGMIGRLPMSITTYLDKQYEDTFDSVYDSLKEMVRQDPDHAEQYVRGILKSLYIRQGNDWTGRGAIGDAGLGASIAAYESILAEFFSLTHHGRAQSEAITTLKTRREP
jgi:hypothetical protein